ncbi:unnamed protein product [Pleuronectes platessa]|uniref:Uncharacterized protein n=1 Tax=Pleuronectes platessa TaxID=8262 RepID=A0A9N7TN17_PLEPL|nr:unnamed protein product [Pleuronectes platessa]
MKSINYPAQTLEEDIILEIQIDPGPNPTTQDDISEDDFSPLDHSTSSSLTDTNTSLSSSDNDPSSRIENGIPIGRRTSSSEVIPRPATEVSESEAAKQLNQDFLLLFGAETASFRSKVINEAKHLTQSIELSQLLKAAEKLTETDDITWESDMVSLLLLLHVLPPTAGRKRTKISPSNAVHFHKSCCSLDEHLRRRDGRQPYILAVGRTRNRIDTFYIVVDKQLIPCQSTSLLGAFDELFKSHYLFNLSYDEYLGQVFTFVQTTVYNIDVATTNESPRVS